MLHADHPIERGIGRGHGIRKVASKRDAIVAGALGEGFERAGVEVANVNEVDALVVIKIEDVTGFVGRADDVEGHSQAGFGRSGGDGCARDVDVRTGDFSAGYAGLEQADAREIASHIADAGDAVCDVEAGLWIVVPKVDVHVPEAGDDVALARAAGCRGANVQYALAAEEDIAVREDLAGCYVDDSDVMHNRGGRFGRVWTGVSAMRTGRSCQGQERGKEQEKVEPEHVNLW